MTEIPENIMRYDYRNTHGWWFRITHDFNKKVSKLFSDSKYGGREQALQAAITFRDTYLKTTLVSKRPTQKSRLHFKRSKHNLVGIRLVLLKGSYFWAASIVLDKKQKVRMWSIDKWGYVQAYQHAREYRLTYSLDQHIPMFPPTKKMML